MVMPVRWASHGDAKFLEKDCAHYTIALHSMQLSRPEFMDTTREKDEVPGRFEDVAVAGLAEVEVIARGEAGPKTGNTSD